MSDRRIGDHGNPGEDVTVFGERFVQRHPLRAHRQAVGRVLDVAAGNDLPGDRLERRPDLEAGELRASARPRVDRGRDKTGLVRSGYHAVEGDGLPPGLAAPIETAPSIGTAALLLTTIGLPAIPRVRAWQ